MTAPGSILRLLADDLTGALDSAVHFTGRAGSVNVAFRPQEQLPSGTLALDCGTREQSAEEASRTADALGGFFAGADIAFRKIDTLMRGHLFHEIAASFANGGFASCVFAPAYPAQGRITREGRQWLVDENSNCRDLSGPLIDRFAAVGLHAMPLSDPSSLAEAGVYVCDASTQAELNAVAAAARALPGPILWCGTGGLAISLGRGATQQTDPLRLPVVLVAGSPHPRTRRQLTRIETRWPGTVTRLSGSNDPHPAERAVIAYGFDLPYEDSCRAKNAIRTLIAEQIDPVRPPAGLIAAGGETLRAIMEHLKAERLKVTGEAAAGVPISRIVGGGWDAVTVASKSGAFGDELIFERLIEKALRHAPPPHLSGKLS